MGNELLTKEEICKWLKVSRATIDWWRNQGLPFIKTGRLVRFDKNAVSKWLKENSKN